MWIHRAIGLLLLSAASMSLSSSPVSAQTQNCPIAADGDVSNAVGTSVHVSPFMVVDSGSAIQCLFSGDGVGDGVLVGRYPGFFGADDVQPFGPDQANLRYLLADGLPAGSALSITPVDGVGDAAAWVLPVDQSAAPDSLGRLLVRRGADAFVIGTQAGPTALDTARSVAQVVLASST